MIAIFRVLQFLPLFLGSPLASLKPQSEFTAHKIAMRGAGDIEPAEQKSVSLLCYWPHRAMSYSKRAKSLSSTSARHCLFRPATGSILPVTWRVYANLGLSQQRQNAHRKYTGSLALSLHKTGCRCLSVGSVEECRRVLNYWSDVLGTEGVFLVILYPRFCFHMTKLYRIAVG